MEEWKEYKLGDVLADKGYIRGPFGSALKRGDMKTEGIPVYEQQHAIYQLRDFRFYIDESKFQEMKRFQVNENDLVISCSGTVGKVTIISKDDPKGIISQALLILRVNPTIIFPKYLQYFFISSKGYNSIISRSSGSVQVNIAKRDVIESIPLSLPPLPTQQKIAAILSSLDDKIELNNKINTNLEQQAGALFDEIFKDDEKDILLGEVIETTSGGTPSRKNMAFYTNGNNCWVKSKELESRFIIDTEEKITDDAINNSAAKLLPENSVLIAMYGATVGAYGIISKPMTCNQAICALLPNENYPYTYLFMFAKNVTQELENLAVGSAQQNISQVLIKKLKVHSDTNKIKEFHSSSNSLFEQMLLIKQENKTLSELRDSLLPKLMNGEIEV